MPGAWAINHRPVPCHGNLHWPISSLRWCKWHVFRTIKAELGQKYTNEFEEELNKICNHMLTSE